MCKRFFLAFLFLLPSFVFSEASYEADSFQGIWKTTAQDVIKRKKGDLVIGIVAALHPELGEILNFMQKPYETYQKGMRTYHKGKLWNIDTILVVSNIGKVAAAIATTELISHFHVDLILHCGVAGSLKKELSYADIAVADGLLQYDVHGSSLPPFVIPKIRVKTFRPDLFLQNVITEAAETFLKSPENSFNKKRPSKVMRATIGTGDTAIHDPETVLFFRKWLPEICCVDMESGSLAQVCYEYDIPCGVFRMISDYAGSFDESDYHLFLKEVPHVYARGILKEIYRDIQNACLDDSLFSSLKSLN